MPGIYLAGNDRYRHKKKKKHIIKYEEKKVRGKRRSSERWSHTCRRFVRFPIDGDKVPERDWLIVFCLGKDFLVLSVVEYLAGLRAWRFVYMFFIS